MRQKHSFGSAQAGEAGPEQRRLWLAAQRLAMGDSVAQAAYTTGVPPGRLAQMRVTDLDFRELLADATRILELSPAAWKARLEARLRFAAELALDEGKISFVTQALRSSKAIDREVNSRPPGPLSTTEEAQAYLDALGNLEPEAVLEFILARQQRFDMPTEERLAILERWRRRADAAAAEDGPAADGPAADGLAEDGAQGAWPDVDRGGHGGVEHGRPDGGVAPAPLADELERVLAGRVVTDRVVTGPAVVGRAGAGGGAANDDRAPPRAGRGPAAAGGGADGPGWPETDGDDALPDPAEDPLGAMVHGLHARAAAAAPAGETGAPGARTGLDRGR